MKSCCFKLYRAYSILLDSSNVVNCLWSWIVKDCIKVQEKKTKDVVWYLRCKLSEIKDQRSTLKRTPSVRNFLFNCIFPFSRFNLHAHFQTFFAINTSTNHVNFLSFDNDDMKPTERQFPFLTLISVLKCISKSFLKVAKQTFPLGILLRLERGLKLR